MSFMSFVLDAEGRPPVAASAAISAAASATSAAISADNPPPSLREAVFFSPAVVAAFADTSGSLGWKAVCCMCSEDEDAVYFEAPASALVLLPTSSRLLAASLPDADVGCGGVDASRCCFEEDGAPAVLSLDASGGAACGDGARVSGVGFGAC